MKDKKKNLHKNLHIIRIIVIILVIILACIFSISYKINKNNDYKNSIIKEIKNNYSLSENINYINIYGNYYIFTTNNKVYVLDNKYKEVYKEDLEKISKNTNNYNLIYRTKKLMYEKTIIKGNKLTYEYYDSKTYKKIGTTKLERQYEY